MPKKDKNLPDIGPGKFSPYRTPQDFIDKFCEYIEDCKANKKVPTIPGACVFMGYMTKQSFYDQKKRDKNGGTEWAQALEFCKMVTEDHLINDRSTMAIFVLKAKYQYEDRMRVDNNHSGQIDLADLTDSQIDARIKRIVEKAK